MKNECLRMRRNLGAAFCFLAVCSAASDAVFAQQAMAGRGAIGRHDPARSTMSRAAAQAEVMKAAMNIKKSDAEAGKIWAEAGKITAETKVIEGKARTEAANARINEASAKIFNAQAFWFMRSQWKRAKLEERGTYVNNAKRRNQESWKLLKDHPELMGRSVPEGRSLNFLLHRLSGTLLAYHFSGEDPPISPEVLESLKLDDRMLHALRLRQPGQGNDERIFRADGSGELEGRWWPYVLRFEEFDEPRRRFEEMRDTIVAQADRGYEINVKQLQDLDAALGALGDAFYKQYPPGTHGRGSIEKFVQIRAAESFLRDLDRQIRRIQTSGDVRGLRPQFYNPKEAGKSITSLLTYMSRNGTEFAPAEPGDEEAYNRVFIMMRDLYIEVADDDAGIQPKTNQQIVEEKFGPAKKTPTAPEIRK